MTRTDHRIMYVALLFLASGFFWAQSLHNGLSGDVFWQLAAGRYMIAHQMILHRDVFSYTLYHKPWVTEEWGYEVILAALVNFLGPVGFWVMSAGLGTLLIVSLSWLLWLRGITGIKNGLLILAATPGWLPFVKDRPQSVSYVFMVWMLIILWQGRTKPQKLWWAVPLLWVWTNIHGSFLLGFLLLVLEGMWMIIPINTLRVNTPPTRLSPKLWISVLGTAVLASFVNGNGPGLWTYSWHVTFSRRIAGIIAEWQSPNFHYIFFVVMILVPMFILVLLMVFGRKKVVWPDFFLVAGLFYATMKSVRFLPYFAIEWPILLGAMTRNWPFSRVKGLLVTPILLTLSVILVLINPVIPPGKPLGEPVLAANYLETHHGHVFNMYSWGGYLISRHIPVFIDGRTDFYLQGHQIGQYTSVKQLTKNPNSIWKEYNVRYVLWAPKTAVATYLLSHSAEWKPVVRTKTAILFQHRGSW
ncbi:MAG: hypothetical protein M1596_03050 [Firmicutes bacterium]|nr:hypothetical protein [Bacillota bacterium]